VASLFLDTSALVRRYDRTEPGALTVRTLCRHTSGHSLLMARIAVVEVAAAFNRKVREGRFGLQQRDQVWRLFRMHWRGQYQVIVLNEQIYGRAERLLRLHPLRAYDAIQLATALSAQQLLRTVSPDFRFCTADRRLAQAARAELAVALIQ
jgi:predicted nucleic acid-binding protein